MRTSLVIAALLASTSAVRTVYADLENDEFVDLQVGVEAEARATVRATLQANLRSFLELGETPKPFPETILPNGTPTMPKPSSNPDVAFLQLSDEDLSVE